MIEFGRSERAPRAERESTSAGVDVVASSGRAEVRGGGGHARAARSAIAAAAVLVATAITSRARAAEDAAAASAEHAEADDDDDDEDASPYALGAEADLDARFVWRGLALSDGPVLQPSAWASAYGFNAVLFANVMLTREAPNRLSAIVPAVSYTFEWKALTIEPGLVYYASPGQPIPPATAEGSLEASLALGRFHLLSTTYIDVAHTPGAYFGTAGIDYVRKIGRLELKGVADVGWGTAPFNATYFDARVAAIDVAEVGARAQWALGDYFYVALHAEGSRLVASALAAEHPATLGNVGLAFGGEL